MRRSTIYKYGLCGVMCLAACSAGGPYHLRENFTVRGGQAEKICRSARATFVVPDLPAADRVVGDLMVSCENGCQQDFALRSLVRLAEQHGAVHVSSLSCVEREAGWVCVGRASAPPICEEET